MRNYCCLLSVILLFSCQQPNQTPQEGEEVPVEQDALKAEETTADDTKEITVELSSEYEAIQSEINPIIHRFYEQLALANIVPQVMVNDSGYYQLALEKYLGQLDSMQMFDSSFIQSERERLAPCMRDLDSMKVSADAELDGIWEPPSCFAEYLYWLRAQDTPDDILIRKGEVRNGSVYAEVFFYNQSDEERYYWDYSYWEMEIKKQEDSYRISSVTIKDV